MDRSKPDRTDYHETEHVPQGKFADPIGSCVCCIRDKAIGLTAPETHGNPE